MKKMNEINCEERTIKFVYIKGRCGHIDEALERRLHAFYILKYCRLNLGVLLDLIHESWDTLVQHTRNDFEILDAAQVFVCFDLCLLKGRNEIVQAFFPYTARTT